ncbi:uncharacterized protein N7500_001722 [Penicillium coprophilum]|uniref:uncharacterized protein n=1 Tax=Penicillium coprophilum TaxID=36646 RepID=UPI002393C6C3|nr:uncharacterized protein N7500_001722 [Penicillium coprophilum]KAJ5173791.1 hypothetical protein N7500_001722 [Penicillium coprophilum]
MEQNTIRRRGLGLHGVDAERVSPGYVLYAPLTSNTAHLVSTTGKEVHRWKLPYRPGRHPRILADGNLAYNGAHPDSPIFFPKWAKYRGGVMMQVSPDGEILRQYSDPLAHHDQHHFDDGTILYSTQEPLTSAEAACVQGGIPSSEAPNGVIYGDCIKLVQPWSTSNISSSADFDGSGGKSGAKLLWSWRAIDHLDPNVFVTHKDMSREHWPMINGVALDSAGDIIASSRNTASVFIVSRATGAVKRRIAAPVVNQQHCPHEINEAGDILLLDNGNFRPKTTVPFSRAIIVSKEGVVKWEYKDSSTGGLGFFSPFMGSAQKLAGGNVLVCEAPTGRIMEVTEGGEVVWEFVVPQMEDYKEVMTKEELAGINNYATNGIFRAYKYRPEEVPWLKE